MSSTVPRLLVLAAVILGSVGVSVAQGSRQISPYDPIEEKDRDNPKARAEWFLRGRTAPKGESAALLRYKAYQQKLQMRQRLFASPALVGNGSSTAWQSLGPAPIISLAAGTGQDYNFVTGRATAVAIDPADSSGNTVFIGGAHGGVWKSTNAGSNSPSPSAVSWTPVADYAGTLAVGAIAIQPGNSNPAHSVILVGTGEPNNSADSYYGLGIMRSADGGSTWNLITSATTGQSFAGLGFSKIAFSTANPNLAVAAAASASEGVVEGLPNQNDRGIYVSTDGGNTWSYASIKDGTSAISVASVTSVVYNAVAAKFFAAIRFHGVYSSTDGANWTRLADANQPGTNLTSALCPAAGAASCLFYRAEMAVVPGRNEMYTWVVDLDTNTGSLTDGGVWESTNGATGAWTSVPDSGITNCGDVNGGCGIQQGTYNLEILALPNGSATDLYAGTINLYKCTINNPSNPSTCSFLNLTHVYGCPSIAKVHPDQHHLAGIIASGKEVMYFANDGGIYRALDGYTGLTTGNCSGTNLFDSLNATLGSMTQVVSFSMHPTDSTVLLAGTQDNGSPATNSGMSALEWQNIHPGDGGYNLISFSPASPNDWFTTFPDVGGGSLEIDHCGSGTSCNFLLFNPVVQSFNLAGDDGSFYFPYILDPQAPTEMLVGTCRLWRVDNAASPTAFNLLSPDFDPASTPPCTGGEVNTVRSIAAGGPKDTKGFSKVIYVGTDGFGPLIGVPASGGRVFVTKDASVASPTFTEVTGSINPSFYPLSSIAMDPSDASGQTAYATIMGFHVSHVFKTTNAGGSWSDFTGTLPDAPVNSAVIDSQAGVIYVGTDVGVFSSPTSGASWAEVGPAAAHGNIGFLPNVPVTALRLFSSGGQKILRASTYGRGVWQFALVTTPDYSITISNTPLTLFGSQTSAFTGTLTAAGGYNSAVTLTCTAGSTAPPSTCTPPAPVTPTPAGAPLSVTVGGAIGDYTFNIHGVGSDSATVTHDASVTLHVVDFALGAPSAGSLTVGQGYTSSNSVSFTVSASGSFSGTVDLSCVGMPAGATCNFSPSASVQPTSSSPVTVTMTVSAQPSTPAGTTPVTISATTTGAPAAKTQPFSVTVTADYQIAISNSTITAPVNTPGAFSGTLTAATYSSPVNLTCGAGAPPSCAVAPPTVTPTPAGATFTVTVQGNAVQNYNFNLNAVGTDVNTTSHAAPLVFNSIFSFALLDSSGTQSVKAGQSATYTLTFTPSAGFPFPSAITPACTSTDLPAGAACAFNPTQVSAGTSGPQTITLTISTLGPNSQAHIGPVARSTPIPPAYAWIAAAGLLIGGLPKRKQTRKRWLAISSMLLLATMLLVLPSCGGGGGGNSIGVSVSAASKQIFPTQTDQFTASVTGTTNTAVSWTASIGSVNASGLYTAPSVTQDTQATITATSQADVSKSGNSIITVKAPTPSGTYTIHVTASTGSGSSLVTQTTTAVLTVQ